MYVGAGKGGHGMFAMAIAQRWRPSWLLASVFLAMSLFLVALATAVAALQGPRLLGYHVAATLRTQWWRVTDVWPGSFAWDAGIRAGLPLHGKAPPATQGTTVVYALAMGRCCRANPCRNSSGWSSAWPL